MVTTQPMTTAPVQIDLWLERFTPTAERVQQALAGVLYATLGGHGRPIDVSNTYDLDKPMGSRIHRAAFADTSQDMALLLPGKPTMMRFIERASTLCESPEPVEKLRTAYEDFLEQIGEVASTQQELVTVLSANDPKLMRETVQRQRAACFYPQSNLAGGCADARSVLWLVTPNAENSSMGDVALVQGYHSLRRLGNLRTITFGSLSRDDDDAQAMAPGTSKQLDGTPLDFAQGGTTVPELSSWNLPKTRVIESTGAIHTAYLSKDIPQGEPVDIIDAVLHPQCIGNIAPESYGMETLVNMLTIPSKLLLIDYIIHQDMWPGLEPQLKIYDVPLGRPNTYPDEYWYLEVQHFDELEPISVRKLQQPIREAPKHADMIRYTVDKTKVNLEDYRVYRLMIRYPVLRQPAYLFFSRKQEEKQTK